MLGVITSAVLGVLFGSFASATAWRLHQQANGKKNKTERAEVSISRGRSMCPHCRHTLAVIDLIPVFSWLWLKGRCRYCKKPIGWYEPVIELGSGVLFAASFVALRPENALGYLSAAVWAYVLVSLLILSIYDLQWYLLPDKVLLPAIAVALVGLAGELALGAPLMAFRGALVAALLVGGGFYLIAAVSGGRWMGGGDIKLAFLMGLLLGVQKTALAMFIAFDSAAIISLGLLLFKLRKRTDHIPFGPFLVLGTVVAMLYGGPVLHWYLAALGYPVR